LKDVQTHSDKGFTIARSIVEQVKDYFVEFETHIKQRPKQSLPKRDEEKHLDDDDNDAEESIAAELDAKALANRLIDALIELSDLTLFVSLIDYSYLYNIWFIKCVFMIF
jgi:hypothetical protein